jgi:hypothetical protein
VAYSADHREATARGYAELVEFAGEHATLRAWAIEGPAVMVGVALCWAIERRNRYLLRRIYHGRVELLGVIASV